MDAECRTSPRQGIVLYSKAGCPFCADAKAALAGEGLAFDVADVGEEVEGSAARRAELAALCSDSAESAPTVPKIVIGKQVVFSSSEELQDLRASSALRHWALKAGARLATELPRQELPRQAPSAEKGSVCLLHTFAPSSVWLEELRVRLASLGAAVTLLDAERLGTFDPIQALPYDVVVNRVSDAARPALARFVASFLALCRVQRVGVVNGAGAYTAATSKLVQHGLFHEQGLRTPPSQVVRSVADVEAALKVLGDGPLLFKPNAGSFGKGIVKFDDPAALVVHARRPAAFGNDGIALVQKFFAVEQTHRVFVLDGKVQCSVAVAVAGASNFSGQCMASAQRRQKTEGGGSAVEKEVVAEAVGKACGQALRAAEADVGSIEYLVDPFSGENFFYDLNLLSTFPDEKVVGKDCWKELAEYILSKKR